MSQYLINSEPSPEEVIELLQQLITQKNLRHRYLGCVATGLMIGIVLLLFGMANALREPPTYRVLQLAIVLIAASTVGVCYLALPFEVIKIARRLELSTDPNTIPPLMDALETALKVSSNNNAVKQLRRTLATLLSRLSTEDSAVLTPQNWEVIRHHLAAYTTLHFVIDLHDLDLILTILNLLKRRRDTRYIATIRNISFTFKGQQLCDAIKECLVVLEEQKRKEDESKVLLRASQPKNQSETLLRPAGYSSDAQAQELLRADNSQIY